MALIAIAATLSASSTTTVTHAQQQQQQQFDTQNDPLLSRNLGEERRHRLFRDGGKLRRIDIDSSGTYTHAEWLEKYGVEGAPPPQENTRYGNMKANNRDGHDSSSSSSSSSSSASSSSSSSSSSSGDGDITVNVNVNVEGSTTADWFDTYSRDTSSSSSSDDYDPHNDPDCMEYNHGQRRTTPTRRLAKTPKSAKHAKVSKSAKAKTGKSGSGGVPVVKCTPRPTRSPVVTPVPSPKPTSVETANPTRKPSMQPTQQPTLEPIEPGLTRQVSWTDF